MTESELPLTARENRQNTVVDCGGTPIGGGVLQVIAGPCSVESEAGLLAIARAVKAAGATMLRGGAFKPRTSPYAFQGLGAEGLQLLVRVGREVGLPVVSELTAAKFLPLYNDVDVIQIGARNMHNYELLREVGVHSQKPVLLKRGQGATLNELLASAEYLLNAGNPQVILCERGIRTFETATRCTLDLVAVPLLKRLTHLPVAVDPSHATGQASLVAPAAMGAAAMGADALMVEVHSQPSQALSDGAQCLTPDEFAAMMARLSAVRSGAQSR